MKQATLLKAWHSKGSSASEVPKPKDKPPDDMIELSDEDDEFLIQAMDETLAGNLPSTSEAQGASSSVQKPLENLEGFDVTAGQTWIYPTNYPVRSYQFNIVQSCLFKNTMVILPTGLGKTFIAAVVMYNFYRWYPNGKIVFMAPTRPLVAQQIEACYKIMGIPLHDTLEMTGTVPAAQRAQGWRERRVFFLTPQVMMNDLLRNALRPQDVKCLVIDEAHKALGSYSYCQVVQEILKYNNQFRILALSATPGTDMKGVRNVLANLMISHVELRTEESIDIQSYTQKRTIEKVVVPLGAEIGELKTKFLGVICTYLDRLQRSGAIPRVNPESLGKYRMLLLKESFQQNPPSGLSPREVGQLQGHFSLLISLYHAFELLLAHGMQPFFYFLKGIVDGEKSQPRVRYELMHNGDFEDLYLHLEQRLGASKDSANDTLHPTAAAAASSLYENTFSHPGDQGEHVVGHPKLAKLEEIILEHFRSFADNAGGTRVMVFSQYRDSVKEITAQLNRHQPVIKAMNFVGQRTGTAKGFSQKEQLLVVRKFREGGYNVLVSTCVGEEGLDIGEIDLIVCFDAPKSPIRLVQRMGRTGRKREGRIVVLLTEGKEEQAYKESNYKKQNIHRAITNGRQLGNLYEQSPRMVPRGIHPVCHRMHMTVPDYDTAKGAASKGTGKGSTRSILNFITGKQKKTASALNRQEELYYEAHYEVAPSAVPILPAASSHFLTLPQSSSSEHNLAEMERDKNRPRLSLSSWTQWQSNEQRSHFMSHSSKTELYVRIMRFIETARYANDELDTYSLELKPFLQMEYVLSSDELLSPDPDLVDPKDDKVAKLQRRRKYTKKKAAIKKTGEETDEEEPADLGKAETKKKKKKKRVITDFFKDMSRSGEESPFRASVETDTCEVAEEMDCHVVIEADDDPIKVVPTPEQLDVDAKGVEEFEEEEDPNEVEIRTPPRLDVDIFPSPGRTLSPVDMAKIVFGEAGGSSYVTRAELVTEPVVDTEDRETGDVACQSQRDDAACSNVRFSKLEIDSDLEDFFADDGFEDEQPLDSEKKSLTEESPFARKDEADMNPELKVHRRQAGSASPAAVEGQVLVKSVHADSFCDELFDSEVDLFEDNAHVKVGSNKEEVADPILISSQMPSPATKLDDMIADECATVQLNDNQGGASSPIIIPSQKPPPPVHSTPCRNARLATLGPAESLGAAASASSVFGEPSPIRKPPKPERADDDWNILGDSDVELFGDASDGDRVSHRSNDASADEKASSGGGQDMGITELCNFIEENSVVEAAWKDDFVSCRTLPPATNKCNALPHKSSSGGPGTSHSSPPPASRPSFAGAHASRDATRPVSRVKSLSIRKLADTSKSRLKAGDGLSERSVDLTEAKGRSVLQDSRNEVSMRTRTVLNKSSAQNSSAALPNAELNETSASKRPSFELTVDWSGFESEDSLDGSAAPAETLTQLRRKRESTLPATLSASGITQSRNVPVALVKPMVSTATKAKKDVSTDEDSPIRVRRKRPRQRRLSSGSSASEPSPLAIRRRALSKVDDSDDDFQVHTCKKQQQTQRNTPRAEASKRKLNASPTNGNSRKNSKKNRNDFIEHEANVSTDVINSSDESENSSLDQLDESFIDDQTQDNSLPLK